MNLLKSLGNAIAKAAPIAGTSILIISGLTIAVALSWIALSGQNHPKELELAAALTIHFLPVTGASLITAFANRLTNPQASNPQNATVFQESVKRFALLSAPIASGYGPRPVYIQSMY